MEDLVYLRSLLNTMLSNRVYPLHPQCHMFHNKVIAAMANVINAVILSLIEIYTLFKSSGVSYCIKKNLNRNKETAPLKSILNFSFAILCFP